MNPNLNLNPRLNPRFIFLLNTAQRHLQQWIARHTESSGRPGQKFPSPAQSAVLFILAKNDGAAMGQLAHALDLAPSAVSGLIQRMEALDWVARQACSGDGRTQRVWLRPAGSDLIPLIRQATKRINARLAEGFTADELQTVARWLAHVRQLDRTDGAAD